MNARLDYLADVADVIDQQNQPLRQPGLVAPTGVELDTSYLEASEPLSGDNLRERMRQDIAKGQTPEQEALTWRLAVDAGVDPYTVKQHLPDVKLTSQLDQFQWDKMTRYFPGAAAFAQEHGVAVVDDLDKLSTLEWLIKMPPYAINKGQLMFEQSDIENRWMNGQATEEDLKRLEEIDAAMQANLGAESIAGKAWEGAWQYGTQMAQMMYNSLDAALLTGTASMVAGSAVPVVGSAAAALAGFSAGFAADMGKQTYEMEAGSAYREYVDAGIDEDTARKGAMVVGSANAAIEMLNAGAIMDIIGIKPLLKRLTSAGTKYALKQATKGAAWKEFFKGAGKMWASETLEETAQELSTAVGYNLAASFTDNDVATLSDAQIARRVLDVTQEAATSLFLLSFIPGSPRLVRNLKHAASSQANQAYFQRLQQASLDTASLERMPVQTRAFVERQAASGEGVQILYMRPGRLADVAAELGTTPEALAQSIPSIREQYQDAIKTGEDLQISMADYVTKIARSDAAAPMQRYLRVRPDDYEAVEVDQAYRDFVAEAQDNVIRLREARERIEKSTAPIDVLYRNVRDSLVATGMDPRQAEFNASVQRAFFASYDENTGGDAADMIGRIGLGVVSQEQIDGLVEMLRGGDYDPGTTIPEDIVSQVMANGPRIVQALGYELPNATDLQLRKAVETTLLARAATGDISILSAAQGAQGTFQELRDRVLATQPAQELNQPGVTESEAAIPEVRDAQGRLLAPNGRPSNLNDRQWHQVRTAAFKAWFGDWEVAGLASHLRDATGSALARRAAQEFVNQPLINAATGLMATVSGTTLGKMTSASAVRASVSPQAHMMAVANLDHLFKLALRRIERAPRKAGDQGRLRAIHHFDAPMPFEGEVLRVKMLIKELADPGQGNRIYTVATVQIEKPASERGESTSGENRGPTPPAGFNERFAQIADAVKGDGVSKVVDENGEPLVVYHGTGEIFTAFDKSKLGSRESKFFFTSSREEAKVYGGGSEPMAVFLASPEMQFFTEDSFDPEYQGDYALDVETDWSEFAVSEPAQIKSATENHGTFSPNDPRILYDSNEKRAGILLPPALGDANVLIRLGENRDPSSFMHESAHLFLEVLRDAVRRGVANEQMRDDWAAITDYLGLADPTQVIPTEAHETFARSFEAYLFEGVSPSVELQGAFRRFRAWLLRVYKQVTALNVKLDDRIRDVFDRMLTTQDQRRTLEGEQGYRALFKSAAEAGMSESDFGAYLAAANNASAAADEQLLKRTLTQLQRKYRGQIREEEGKERQRLVEASKVYQAITFLTGEQVPEGMDRVRLSASAIETLFDDGAGGAVPVLKGLRDHGRGAQTPYTRSGDGVHPDAVAGLFGFDSGFELVEAMADAEPLKKKAHANAVTKVGIDLGNPMDTGQLAEAALAAVHNDERGRFLETELKALSRAAHVPGTPRSAAQQAARDTVLTQTVGSLSSTGRYLQASQRAARAAEKALASGDVAEAVRQKRAEVLSYYLYREASKARDRADTIQRHLLKFNNPGTRQNLSQDYLDQIDQLLEHVNLKRISKREVRRRQSLADFIQSQEAQGNEVVISEDLRNHALKPNYQELTYEQFEDLDTLVRNIEHLGRLKNKLLASQEKRAYDAVVEAMVAQAEQLTSWNPEQPEFGQGAFDELNDWAGAVHAEHRKAEFLFSQLDGNRAGGIWWEKMFRPIADAENAEQAMLAPVIERMKQIMEQFGVEERASWFTRRIRVPEMNRTFHRSELFAMALNMGNEDNVKQLTEGYGWTLGQVNAALDHLTEAEWQAVQQIWDLIDEFWPAIAELQKELTGVVPKKVQRTPVLTRYGALPGGYYPLRFDPKHDQMAAEREAKKQDLFSTENNWLRPYTQKGHTKERVEHKGIPLRLELSVLTEHINNVVHDLTHRKAIMQVERLRNDPRIQRAIKAAAGRHAFDQVRPWLQAVANDYIEMNSNLEKAIGWLRHGATVVNMGLKFTTAIVQPLGYTQTVDLIGEKWAWRGLQRFYGNPLKAKQSLEFVFDKSIMMRNRAKTFDRDMRDAMKQIAGTKASRLKQNLEATYFSMIGFMDMSVAAPTWLGAYEKALAEGRSDLDAVADADSAVRMSQGSGSTKDLAAIQRGSEFKRLFTMFYSYFNALYNLMVRRGQIARQEGGVIRTLASFLYLVALPAVLSEVILGRGPEDDEEWGKWLAKTIGAYPFLSVVGVRDIVNSLVTDYGYSLSPIAQGVELIGGGVKDTLSGDWDRWTAKQLFIGSGFLLHLPTRQAWLTMEHLYDVLNGDEDFSLYELLIRRSQ